jgi:hypothetical protein
MTAASVVLLLGVLGLAVVVIGLPLVLVRIRRVAALGVPPRLLGLALALGVLAVVAVAAIVAAVVLR